MTTTFLPFLALAFVALVVWVVYKALRGILWVVGRVFLVVGMLLRHVLRFVRSTVVDAVHTVGALVTAGAIVPLALANLLIGRPSAARYYGGAAEDEVVSALLSLYRVTLGNPLRLLGLGVVVEGLERRLPELVDRAPSHPRKRAGGRGRADRERFDGYEVVGSLPEGGSGARLFLARPRPEKRARLRERGLTAPEKVVIKSFAVGAGSTLPQIVRENRALEAAKALGYVIEHELGDDRFHYVMPYVEGAELGEVVHRMHDRSGPRGLGDPELGLVLGYAQDLLYHLERFHAGGLWHKDIKPANVIVAGDRAHLVDLGLVTPLASAMTLTTHGTEYYRDPEMVRLALKGVKVHEVDGVRFDIYSAGAVLYSMVENSFPAHGSLSRVTKRVPEALAWIIRRSMADMNARYRSAREALDDLAVLATSSDPFSVRPADLPSFRGAASELASEPARPDDHREVPFASPPPPPTAGSPWGAGQAAEGVFPDDEVRRKAQRRRRRRVCLTAVFLAFLGMNAAGVFSEGRRGKDGADRWARETLERFEEPHRRAYETAQRILHDAGRPIRPRSVVFPSAASTPPAFGSQLEGIPGGRVLILEDLPPGEDVPVVSSLGSLLRSKGFEVLGEPGSEEDSIGITAEARRAIGFSDLEDREAVLDLQAWLDARSDLDAVLWLASGEQHGEGGDERPLFQMLVRSAHEVDAPRRLELQNALAGPEPASR